MSEAWEPVVGWEGLYEVSDWGRVRSLERLVRNKHGYRRVRPRILKQTLGTDKKLHVGLHCDNTATIRSVHHLVLEAFIGPRPPGLWACHYNDIGHDNRLVNLRWDTPDANQRDAVRNGTHYQSSKTHCKLGHEYTPSNTVRWSQVGGRRCRTCANAQARARYWAKKLAL